MSHCVMYKNVADCDKSPCSKSCPMFNSNRPEYETMFEKCPTVEETGVCAGGDCDGCPEDDPCDTCKAEGRRCIIESDFTAEPGYCYAGRC